MRHRIEETRWPSAEEAAGSLLFSPIAIGPITIASRTWVPAMVPWRATEEGVATPEVIAWYGRFAEGRPGAIVVEATGIRDVPSGPLLRIGHDRFIPGLATIANEVRKRSGGQTKLLIQIIDFLAIKRRPDPAKFFERFLVITREHRERLAELEGDLSWIEADEPSVRRRLSALGDEGIDRVLAPREREDLRFGYRERVTDLHLRHVRELPKVLPELFASAARRAEEAGFDGVELHFAHAYTMASFLSKLNDRSDGYGGSRENRVRLAIEVFHAARGAISSRTALGARFLADEIIAGGSRSDDAAYYGLELAKAGADFLSLSRGGKFEDAKQPKIGHAAYPYTGESGHECMPTIYSDDRGPFGRNLPDVRRVRDAVRAGGFETPIVASGGLNTFEIAEAALLRGDCDIVGAARQSLADPDWFSKMRLGRGAEIRRCAMTNYCEGLDQQHKQVTCRLWDRAFEDGEGEVLRTIDGKRRLVAPPWRTV
jgi:dimethylglycine catabolism A